MVFYIRDIILLGLTTKNTIQLTFAKMMLHFACLCCANWLGSHCKLWNFLHGRFINPRSTYKAFTQHKEWQGTSFFARHLCDPHEGSSVERQSPEINSPCSSQNITNNEAPCMRVTARIAIAKRVCNFENHSRTLRRCVVLQAE